MSYGQASDRTWLDLCDDDRCLSRNCPECAAKYKRNRRPSWWKRLLRRLS